MLWKQGKSYKNHWSVKQPSLPHILAAQLYEHQTVITDAAELLRTMKHFFFHHCSVNKSMPQTQVYSIASLSQYILTCCLIFYFIIKSALSLVELFGENLVKWQSCSSPAIILLSNGSSRWDWSFNLFPGTVNLF